MSESSSPLEASEYARHGRFVRRLALRMAADEATAADLAQDAWLAAIQAGPVYTKHLRSWFARVVRNKFVQRLRSESRRRVREESVAAEEHAVDTAEVVERMELHQLVMRAILDLPEPYRTVLVRRFSEEEEVSAIAAHLGLPEATVRTRQRRGLKKLREGLRDEMGGSPAVFLLSLERLATPLGPAPVPPPVAVPPAPLILSLMMKKSLLLTVAAVAALALVWSVSDQGNEPHQAVESSRAASPTAEPQWVAGVESEPVALTANARLSERVEVEVEVEADAVHSAPDDAALEDRDVPVEDPVGTVTFRIEDVYGAPIPLAKLHATQWRSVEDPSSSIWWGDEDARYMGESDLDGVVHLRYRRKQSSANKGTVTVGSVGFEVSHPEYITHTEYGLDVLEEDTVIKLERGSFLIVSGWIDSPAETVTDVKAYLTHDVDVGPQDWIPIGDGRPSCSRIPPGLHGIYISYEDHAGQSWFSEVVTFELVEGEQREIALELRAAGRMVGMLAEQVPRPVQDGEVELNLYVSNGADAVMLRTYREYVESDGRFTFTNLPQGAGEIIGLCDGWVSSRIQLADSSWIEPEEEGGQRRWQRMWQLQQLDPAEHVNEPYVLVMEPTASARITVEDPAGGPVQGAIVTAWPNVHWEIGYSSIFLDRTWKATTDSEGVALLKNMPARDSVYFGVQTVEGYLMPREHTGEEGARGARIALASGEMAEQTIRMAPPE